MVGHAQSLSCKSSLPRPRIYTYPIPGHIAPPPTHWRNVRALKLWLERSRFHEDNPFCADYFHISTHPNNRDAEHARSVGDQNMVRLMDYIRMTWPFWNQSVRTGRARHFMVLPCDHGPGDCAYSRPLTPNKYSPVRPMRLRQWGAVGHETIADTWGDAWETINPASPNRLLIYLLYNGWADQLRNSHGSCLNCFQYGLDIRMPTPEGHECGIACGLHMQHVLNTTGVVRSYLLPSELQRVLLSRAASRSPAVNSTAPRAPSRCLFSWGGAVRGRSNPARNELLKLRGSPGMCIVNTEDAQMVKERPPNIPEAMMESRFCYSPRGWDQGDSDRYLPAVVYGCVPVMSDRLEAMPLEELPDLSWNETVVAIEREELHNLHHLLQAVSPIAEQRMLANGAQAIQRMLYTTFEFSPLNGRHVACAGCASFRTDCPTEQIEWPGMPRFSEVARPRSQPCTGRGGSSSTKGHACRPRKIAPMNALNKLRGPAKDVNVNLTSEAVCGRTSYFNEDGSRDAFEGFVEVLRLRLFAPSAPPEPWSTIPSGMLPSVFRDVRATTIQPTTWFQQRSAYYAKLVQEVQPLTSLIRPAAPAQQHRRSLSMLMGLRRPGRPFSKSGS